MFTRAVVPSTIWRNVQKRFSSVSGDKVVVTAALNGVLTDPMKFQVPVTPSEMATAAAQAYDAGASVVHVHFRDQRPGMGHLPTWDPAVGECSSLFIFFMVMNSN
jgi:hypothetical protein